MEEISKQRLSELLRVAFETSPVAWARITGYTRADSKDFHGPYDNALNPGGAINLRIEGRSARLDLDAIHHGLKCMAAKFPQQFAAIVEGNDDAHTADLFLQCALFGGVLF